MIFEDEKLKYFKISIQKLYDSDQENFDCMIDMTILFRYINMEKF